ncbi:unnamed protein product [Acanthosepion pharaonis]|uniref:Organic cation transporter n=1 Tax=Acanthosepion pharaonis TaxID=158019 RepID=A0A812AKX6_ACAPH|nr:unnamed protein product [Sepia pharaonis]
MDETVELNATLHSLINKLMDKYCLVRHFGGQQIKMCAIMALHKFLSTVAQIIFLSQDRTDRIGNMSDNDAASYQPKSYDIPGSAVTRRCAIPDLPNDTYAIQDTDHADLVKAYIPQHMEDGERKYNNCYFYSNETLGGNGTMHACNSWVYDKSQYQTSVTSDMNLVCDRAIFTSHVKTVFFVGAFIMFLIGGWISDKKQFSGEFTSKQRLFISLHPFFIGRRRSWRFWCAPCICNRNYIHEVSIPTVTGNTNWVSCCFYFDFSDRVLHKSLEIVNNHHLSTINTIGIINHVVCPRVAPNDRSVKVWKIFTVRTLLKKTLIMMFNWGTMIFVYYGMTLNIGVLAGNVYLNLVLNSIVEISVILFAAIVVDRLGRKKLTLFFMVASGITGILTLFPYLYASKDQYWTITALTTFSRMCVSGASSIIYLYTCELYPTCIRNSSVGFFGAFARVGGVISPYIMDISTLVPGRVGKSLPLMVMGFTCFVSGILIIFLPETTNKPMQDTLDEVMNNKHTNNSECKGEMDETLELNAVA